MTDFKPKLRWFQYSLRTLLVLVTLCAFACSWLAVKMQQAKRQRETVVEIEKLGGLVQYDWSYKGHYKTNPTPRWLRSLMGEDLFQSVSLVKLNRTKVTDAGLEHLKGLTQLQILDLSYTQVTDSGLEHLKGLSQLQGLGLIHTQITESGLEHLKGLSQLELLHLEGTHVTHAGVMKLQQALPNCAISYIPAFER